MASPRNSVIGIPLHNGPFKEANFSRHNGNYGFLLLSCSEEVHFLGSIRNILLDQQIFGISFESHDRSSEPCDVKAMKIQDLMSISGISFCGKFGDALAYTRNGELYVWGANALEDPSTEPIILENLPKIIDAKCIQGHYLALTNNGKIYEWRGVKTYENKLNALNTTPTLVELSEEIISIACGPNHSLAVTTKREVYSFGNYVWCNGRFLFKPAAKIPFKGETIAQVACGLFHSLVLTHSGKIYTWGSNQYGLGDDGDSEQSDTPLQVGRNIGRFCEVNTNGFLTNVAITLSGDIYLWGCNEEGNKVMKPTLIRDKKPYEIFIQINCSTTTWRCKENNYCVTEEDFEILGKKMASTFDVEELSDLTLYVENKPIYVHKFVLRLRSEFFRTWLQEHWIDKHTRHLEIRGHSYEVYVSYLWFLYSGKVDTTEEHIIDLYNLALECGEERLRRRCEILITLTISTDTLLFKSRTMKPILPIIESPLPLEERINKINAEYEKQCQRLKNEYINSLEKLNNEYKVLQENNTAQFVRLSALVESEVSKTENGANELKLKETKLEQDFTELEKSSELRIPESKPEGNGLEEEISKLKSEQTFEPPENSTDPETGHSEIEVQEDGKGNVGNPKTLDLENTKKRAAEEGIIEKPELDRLQTKETHIKTHTCQSEIEVNDVADRNHFETEEIPRKKQRFEKHKGGYAELQHLYTKVQKEKANLEAEFKKLQEKHKKLEDFLKNWM